MKKQKLYKRKRLRAKKRLQPQYKTIELCPFQSTPQATLSQCYPAYWGWLRQNLLSLRRSLRELVQKPLSSLITLCVLAIAISLPLGFHLLAQNLQQITPIAQLHPNVSLYLNNTTNPEEAAHLVKQLQTWPTINKVRYISSTEGLKQLTKRLQLSNLLSSTENNPLPAVIVVQPNAESQSPQAIGALEQRLNALPGIMQIQVDNTWIKRLYFMLATSRHFSLMLMLLFTLGATLLILHTLKLNLDRHKKEIQVLELIGAPTQMVRGPLIYRGMWLGLLSSIISWGIISMWISALQPSVSALAATYHSLFQLRHLSAPSIVYLLVCSAAMGWLGALGTLTWYQKEQNKHHLPPQKFPNNAATT